MNKFNLFIGGKKSKGLVLSLSKQSSATPKTIRLIYQNANSYCLYIDNSTKKIIPNDVLKSIDVVDSSDVSLFTNQSDIKSISTTLPFSFDLSELIFLENLEEFIVLGENTLSGNFLNLPPKIKTFRVEGQNTITSNLEDLPYGCNNFLIAGNSNISSYTSREWRPFMQRVSIETNGGSGMNASEVEDLLKDLSETSWLSNGLVRIKGNHNSIATATSQPFIDELRNKGVTVDLPITTTTMIM